MEKVLNSNSLEEGALKRSILLLYQKMIKKMPEYFSEQELNVIHHPSFSEIVVQLKEQNMLEKFITDMEVKLHLHILYATREEEGKVYKVVAYSTPVEDEMLVFYFSSAQYGLINTMTVFIFESLETMYCHLLNERNRMTKVQKNILEQESYAKMLSHFN